MFLYLPADLLIISITFLKYVHGGVVPVDEDIKGLSGAAYYIHYESRALTRGEAAKKCTLSLKDDRDIVDFMSSYLLLPPTALELPTCWTGLSNPTSVNGSLEAAYKSVLFHPEPSASVAHNYVLCQKSYGNLMLYKDCHAGWKPGLRMGRCYKFFTELTSFDAAQRVCQSEGGTLFEPKVPADIYDIIAVDPQASHNSHVWIGLRISKHQLVWNDQRLPLSKEDTLVTPVQDSIDRSKSQDKCILIKSQPSHGPESFAIDQFNCDSKLKFYCQKEKTTTTKDEL